MVRTSIIVLSVIFLLPIAIVAQNKQGYEINGNVEGSYEGEIVQMQLFSGSGFEDYKIQESATIKNGSFHINGVVPEGPRFYFLKFVKSEKIIRMLVDNGEHITINCSDLGKINHGYIEQYVDISGDHSNLSWKCLIPAEVTYNQNIHRLDDYLDDIRDSAGFDRTAIEAVIGAKHIINKNLYNIIFWNDDPDKKPARVYRLTESMFRTSGHSSVFAVVYDSLSAADKNSFYGRILKEDKMLCVGQPFPSFSLPDPDGQLISSKEVIQKSKLTLVQFWATSGVSHLKEFLEPLKGHFRKYHEKGFNVIGFSSDTDTLEWKIRTQAMKLPWYNVSDLKGEKGLAETVYHEGRKRMFREPVNVLIDANGKIVAWGVRGAELQWYLWKYFEEGNGNKEKLAIN